MNIKFILLSGILCIFLSFNSFASLPGSGVKVQPLQSSIGEENFQTLIVIYALKALGYEVEPLKHVEEGYATVHQMIAEGEGTFMADHWFPAHTDYYNNNGGDEVFYKKGTYSDLALQGYLIDAKTAEKYGITHINQLADPELAKLFDKDGDGKADLVGCEADWGCYERVEDHLDAYGLRQTVTNLSDNYNNNIRGAIRDFADGKPILYFGWTPYWVSGALEPYEDSVWLEVPFSSAPGSRKDVDTSLEDGTNYGYKVNSQHIVANRQFTDKNPSAAKLFEIMELPNIAISQQNLKMSRGERTLVDAQRHAKEWIKENQKVFDSWIETAKLAN